MAGKATVIPQAYRKGVWVHILNVFLPLREFTQKVVECKRGREKWNELVDVDPFAMLLDPRDPDQTSGGISGLAGRLTDAEGNHTPEVLGDTFVVIDGEVVPFTLIPGMTGTEGKLNANGKPRKRNPKFDTGDGVPVVWHKDAHTFRIGISQTGDNSLYMWGSLRKPSEKKVDESKLVDLSELASIAAGVKL